MDDLIPILILLLISIIGAATRKKKKRSFPGSIVEEEPRQRDDDFLGWMQRMGMVEDEPLQQPVVEMKAEPEIVEEVTPEPVEVQTTNKVFDEYSGFISPEEHKRIVDQEAPHKPMEHKTPEISDEYIKDGEIGSEENELDFDLRRAVIFSTILERKYD